MPDTNRLTHHVKESQILKRLRSTQASEILFHHRFPTSTGNVQNACHPFSTKGDYFGNKQYILVHNGVVHNDDELKEEHAKLGLGYVSTQKDGRFNDSEALLYDIALTLSGQQEEMKAEGSIAFICIELEDGKPLNMHFGRNTGSPLMMRHKPGRILTLSSEGKGVNVPADTLHTFNYATNQITTRPFEVPYYSKSWGGYGYAGGYTSGGYSGGSYSGYPGGNTHLTPGYNGGMYQELLELDNPDRWEKEYNANNGRYIYRPKNQAFLQDITAKYTRLSNQVDGYVQDLLTNAGASPHIALEWCRDELMDTEAEWARVSTDIMDAEWQHRPTDHLEDEVDYLTDQKRILSGCVRKLEQMVLAADAADLEDAERNLQRLTSGKGATLETA